MALAILEFLTIDKDRAKFRIDTGTNKFYYLKIGKTITERSGIRWVDDVSKKTPLEQNDKSDTLINSGKEISLSGDLFNREDCYVQLFSFKNDEGKSPAFSKVIKVPVKLDIDTSNPDIYSLSTSGNNYHMAENSLNPHRNIPHRNCGSRYGKQASYENILLDLVKMAGPVVMGILSGLNGTKQDTTGTANSGIPQIGMFNTILQTLLNGAQKTSNTTPVATAASVSGSFSKQNRFLNPRSQQISRPMMFGIDDAVLASLAGPLLQMLPQLISADNQQKLQESQQENKFITDILAETNRDMLLNQFLENQATGTGGNGIDINKLMQLLQQAPQQAPQANQVTSPVNNATKSAPAVVAPAVAPAVVPAAAPTVTPPVATTKSLSKKNLLTTLSTNVILVFEAKPGIKFNGKDHIVYNKKSNIKLPVKLSVTGTVPETAFSKTITKICFKDGMNQTVFEKIFKQKDVLPNSVLDFDFTVEELNHLPSNSPVQAFAEMKWLSSENIEVKALGTTEIVFAESYFLKEQGRETQDEKEPVDMKIYRSFWNKVWESPVPDSTNTQNNSVTKYHWELNANLKYTMMLSADHDSNGLMETKMLKAENSEDSLTEKTEGRMKAGIELSVSELNKMISLWANQQVLSDEKLAALKIPSVVSGNAFEFVYNIKLKGRINDRGMIWIVPVLKLYNFSLNKIKNSNDSGQVTEVEEETVLFPLPVSARILGLKTK